MTDELNNALAGIERPGPGICPRHEIERRPGPAGPWCPECAQESRDDRARAERATVARVAIARAQADQDAKFYNALAVQPHFRDATFENYVRESPGQAIAWDACRSFVDRWPAIRGLVLIGKVGTGKDHLSAAVAKEIMARGHTAIMTEAVKIVRRIKLSWKKWSDLDEGQVIAGYVGTDLLIVNELGLQFCTTTEGLFLSEIINDRYNQDRPTILAGNIDMDQLTSVVGERAIDRFRENARVVVFDWDSYRKQDQ
jgi:DNA replication protein DnaC